MPLWRQFGRFGKVYITASAVIAAAALAVAAASENYVLWGAMIVVTLPSSVPAYMLAFGAVLTISFLLGAFPDGSWLVTAPIMFFWIVMAAVCNVLMVQLVASGFTARRSRPFARSGE